MSFFEICRFFPLKRWSIKVKLEFRPRLLGLVAAIFHVQCALYFSNAIFTGLASYSYIVEVPANSFKVNCFETEFKITREQTISANLKILS
jgi:hypothetical protein